MCKKLYHQKLAENKVFFCQIDCARLYRKLEKQRILKELRLYSDVQEILPWKLFFGAKLFAHDCTENSNNSVFKRNCIRTVMCKKLYHENLEENKVFCAKSIAHDCTEN